MSSRKLKPNLSGVPETMLGTLHNRVSEAGRDDGMLHDPEAVRIYKTLDYDFDKSFGAGEPTQAVRSAMFDAELREFLDHHPDGVIVNLAEGLETQRFRVAGDEALWLSVDLPEAIAIRERFIAPDDKHRHVALSALDRAWFDEVPKERPVYLTAQGLLMYLPEEQVRMLFKDLAKRFPGAWFTFDTIPRWLSRKTVKCGWKKTAHYTTPKMPWGINRHQIAPTLRAWVPTLEEVMELRWWRFPRGVGRWLFPLMFATPILNRYAPPVITRVRFK
ncbi:MAG: class I SAM-dependent methyltransferase, partial [Planctomycetota bacterium]